MDYRILVVEDDASQREIIADILRDSGFQVDTAANAAQALALVEAQTYDALLTDVRMPGQDGMELLRAVKRIRPDLEVIMMTAHGTIRSAVAAMREGASDFLEKPFEKEELLHVLRRTLERGELRRENARLRAIVAETTYLGNIVGKSPAMQRVFERIQRAVHVDSTVLILGESGTGKELVARHIHFAGRRKDKPFVVVNCAALPDALVESELFGHEKGAFTGADAAKPGKFELAEGGTLFLDEIGDMRLESQAKLLRVLQDGVVERVGGTKPRSVNVRVIVATNRNLRQRVAEGTFREDLFYRLEVLVIELPPLRERLEDLPHLIAHFRKKLGAKLGIVPPTLSADAVDAMRRYRWPGNVRELEHTLEQLFILCPKDVIDIGDLPEKFRHTEPPQTAFVLPPGGIVLEELEEDLIRQALARSGGRIKEAAELLGITYKTLQYRLKKHEIDRHELAP